MREQTFTGPALYQRHVIGRFADAGRHHRDEVRVPWLDIRRAWPGAAAVQRMLLTPGLAGYWTLARREGPTERESECVFKRAKPYPVRKLAAE